MSEQVILQYPELRSHEEDECIKKSHRKGSSTQTASLTLSQCSIQSLDHDVLSELTEALCNRRQNLGDSHPKVGESLNFIGNFHFRRGQYSLACESYRLALPCFQSLTLSAHDCNCKLSQTKGLTATIVTLTNLGTVLWVLGELDESIHVLEDALTKYRQVYPIINDVKYPSSDHLDIGKVYYNLSIVRFLKHEYHLSHIWMDKAHCTWELQYGPCHIATARALDGLGKINLLGLGKVQDAHRFHDAALRIKEYVMGKRHTSTLFSMSNLASVLVQQGDYLKALRLLESVLQIQDERLLEPNGQNISNLVDVGNTLQKMGRIWFMMEKGDDGMRAFHQALSHYKAAGLDDSDVRVASILETIK